MLLSVIVPCYNEEENVPIFYEEMMKNSDFLEREGLDLEIIYIDDGSKDATAAEVKKLHEKDGRVHLVSFREISARRQVSMPDSGSQREIMW